MQWTAVRHQHAVWCWRGTYQCAGQPAGLLIKLQSGPHSKRLLSAARQHWSSWECICAVYLFISFRLPDPGKLPAQEKILLRLAGCTQRRSAWLHLLLMPAYSACVACCTLYAVSPICSMSWHRCLWKGCGGLPHVALGSVHVSCCFEHDHSITSIAFPTAPSAV